MTLLHPKLLWLNGKLHRETAVTLEDGKIKRVAATGKSQRPDLRPHLMMPACTDLQVNGAGGVMLNSQPDAAGVKHIVSTLRARGTGWALPTLITTSLEDMRAAAKAVMEAWGYPGLLGVHFEGPYLNVMRKGAHKASMIRPFEPEAMEIFAALRHKNIPVMVTLAPECVPADIIAELTWLGVVVSAGHTNATADEARAGLAAGVSCFTHLYNAMPQMTSRDPGTIAVALKSNAFCGIIADGIHVDWQMLQLAVAARPEIGRTFIVSDAMATIGGPDHFELDGQKIEVRDNRLVNAEGSLAGAHIDMVASLRNAVEFIGVPMAEAIAMCTDVPHHVLGLAAPQIEVGRDVMDILALDDDLQRMNLTENLAA